jgi:hypothetical protein
VPWNYPTFLSYLFSIKLKLKKWRKVIPSHELLISFINEELVVFIQSKFTVGIWCSGGDVLPMELIGLVDVWLCCGGDMVEP